MSGVGLVGYGEGEGEVEGEGEGRGGREKGEGEGEGEGKGRGGGRRERERERGREKGEGEGEGRGRRGRGRREGEATAARTGVLFYVECIVAMLVGGCRESRVEQTEGRYKGYRQELKHHAEALMKVSQELQTERANQVKLKAELNQCRQELRSLEKTGHDLKEEQSTSNLLREQVEQLVT